VTFLSAAQSVQDSEPRELFTIGVNGAVFARHTSATRDIEWEGVLFTAIALQRGELAITMPGQDKDLILTLPIDHAFVRRWTRQGIPPRLATLELYRQDGGETEIIWAGNITSMSAEGGTAKFRVPSMAGEWMLRPIPAFTVGKECNHVLFDSGCTLLRTGSHSGLAFKVTTTVTHVNGRDIRVDLGDTDRNGDWAEGGEVVHTSTGERMGIATQTDLNPGSSSVADLRMQLQIVGLQVGHSVDIYAGCNRLVATCNTKFGNKANFVGFPQLPSKNPFVPAGYGVAGNK
jgi:uncharacterized phage protein (TIGR02218 family)